MIAALKKVRHGLGMGLLLAAWMTAPASAGAAEAGTALVRPSDAGLIASIARGGRLYDKWFKELPDTPGPATRHSLYPETGPYAGKAPDTWRCKECHGWDGLGKNGAYGSGKHATGIKGIQAMDGGDPERVAALLKAPEHGYGGLLTDRDLTDLAHFVTRGQWDMDAVIDRAGKTIKGGDPVMGQVYYLTLCAQCHGRDGKAKGMPKLGEVVNDNPWESLHKILNGQPGDDMPALRGLDRRIVKDLLAFLQTLPR
ncbi:MAG: c-type cytochrome [Magnetococcales bacterium]|nr:c-type cytochrome [Magnetococcales bacterium]